MKISSVSRSLGLATLMLLATAGTSKAGYIATDLGAGNAYNPTSGYNLCGPSSANSGYNLAVEFTVGGTAPVAFGSAQLALSFGGGPNALSVLLLANNGGMPGTTLETISLTNIPAGPSLVTATSTTNTMLNPGTSYWLAAVATGTTAMNWWQNSQGSMNHLAYQTNSASGTSAWNLAPGNPDLAYSISAVPAPSSAILLGTGLVGMIGVARRRRPIVAEARSADRGV